MTPSVEAFADSPISGQRFLVADDQPDVRTIENQARETARQKKVQQLAKSDVEIARQVQQISFLSAPQSSGAISYAGRCVPPAAVGGDYNDFLSLGPGETALC